MAVHFHPLRVKEVRKETADCVSVVFHIPEELRPEYIFEHGQNITLRTNIDGEDLRRSYSICSSPAEAELRVAIKKVEGGKFSVFANEKLQAGDTLHVLPPTGRFNSKLQESQAKNYLAIAAGSGITPIISIIKTTLLMEPASSFTLLYGNKTRASIIFFEALEALKNKYLQRFNLIHVLSREQMENPLNNGRIDTHKLEQVAQLVPLHTIDEFFVCGPEAMIFMTKDFLEKQNISSDKIHFELFNSGLQKTRVTSPEIFQAAPGAQVDITVKADGRIIHFKHPMEDDVSLLDAALQQGADLPFACKGGMCCTCKAKLEEGSVHMDVSWGLEKEEIAQGYILTCQSHPRSEKIVVDFDIK